jgi:hypothetical protein
MKKYLDVFTKYINFILVLSLFSPICFHQVFASTEMRPLLSIDDTQLLMDHAGDAMKHAISSINRKEKREWYNRAGVFIFFGIVAHFINLSLPTYFCFIL